MSTKTRLDVLLLAIGSLYEREMLWAKRDDLILEVVIRKKISNFYDKFFFPSEKFKVERCLASREMFCCL